MTDAWQPATTYLPGAIVVPRSGAAPGTIDLLNGDFEDATLDHGAQYDGPGVFSLDTTKSYSGSQSLKYNGNGKSGFSFDTPIPAVAGVIITVTGAFYAQHDSGSYNVGSLAIQWLDSGGAQIGQPTEGAEHGASGEQGGAWRSIGVVGTAPAGTASARILIWANSNSGSASSNEWFDAITVQSNAAPPTGGLVYRAVQTGPGRSAANEPIWPSTVGTKVDDGTVIWGAMTLATITWECEPLMTSGATEPTWPIYAGQIVPDGNIQWTVDARNITDPNCPASRIVAMLASKIFAADNDIVRFSATNNPTDWTSEQDAGFLPTGLRQPNSNHAAVLASYRGNLCVFNAGSFQNWQVDPDPANMALLDEMEGIGSIWQHGAQPVANDLFYVAALGVRTVGVSAASDNLAAGDSGMVIDSLVRPASLTAVRAVATYYPAAGQYMLGFLYNTPEISGQAPDNDAYTFEDAQNYSYQYAITGGRLPYTVTIGAYTGGAVPDPSGDGILDGLPSGLAISDTGLLAGDSTSGFGTYRYDVVVTDAAGVSVSLPDYIHLRGWA